MVRFCWLATLLTRQFKQTTRNKRASYGRSGFLFDLGFMLSPATHVQAMTFSKVRIFAAPSLGFLSFSPCFAAKCVVLPPCFVQVLNALGNFHPPLLSLLRFFFWMRLTVSPHGAGGAARLAAPASARRRRPHRWQARAGSWPILLNGSCGHVRTFPYV